MFNLALYNQDKFKSFLNLRKNIESIIGEDLINIANNVNLSIREERGELVSKFSLFNYGEGGNKKPLSVFINTFNNENTFYVFTDTKNRSFSDIYSLDFKAMKREKAKDEIFRFCDKNNINSYIGNLRNYNISSKDMYSLSDGAISFSLYPYQMSVKYSNGYGFSGNYHINDENKFTTFNIEFMSLRRNSIDTDINISIADYLWTIDNIDENKWRLPKCMFNVSLEEVYKTISEIRNLKTLMLY